MCAGSLDGEAIEGLRREIVNVRRCYDRQLKSDPSLRGRIVIELLLLEDGRVCSVRATDDQIGNPELLSCVLAFLQSIRIEPEHGCVTVNVPLNFKPYDADAGP